MQRIRSQQLALTLVFFDLAISILGVEKFIAAVWPKFECLYVQYADPKMACLIIEGQAIFGSAYCTVLGSKFANL